MGTRFLGKWLDNPIQLGLDGCVHTALQVSAWAGLSQFFSLIREGLYLHQNKKKLQMGDSAHEKKPISQSKNS